MAATCLKVVVGTLAFGVATEVVYRLCLRLIKCARKNNLSRTEVLFFPDIKVACIDHFTQSDGCKNKHCKFTHEENSLSRLFKVLSTANKSLDVCVFVLTCADLVKLLIYAHKRGVAVRVITDNEQVDVPGSQVWRLRSEGIVVRTDDSSFFMHHKFVIVDGALLVNGSFNWTKQAITGNQENLLVTNDQEIVQPYKAEFSKLWTVFDRRTS